jgi:hypothetical protein
MLASAIVEMLSPSVTVSLVVASGVGSSDPGSFGSFGPPDPGFVAGSPGPAGDVVAGLKL